MCTAAAATSEACLACKRAVSDLVANLEWQRQYSSSYGPVYQHQQRVLDSCIDAMLALNATHTRCAQLGALGPQAVSASSAAALCAAHGLCQTTSNSGGPDCSECAGFLAAFKVRAGKVGALPAACLLPAMTLAGRHVSPQDLVLAGAVAPTADALWSLCYSTSQYGGGSSLEG